MVFLQIGSATRCVLQITGNRLQAKQNINLFFSQRDAQISPIADKQDEVHEHSLVLALAIVRASVGRRKLATFPSDISMYQAAPHRLMKQKVPTVQTFCLGNKSFQAVYRIMAHIYLIYLSI